MTLASSASIAAVTSFFFSDTASEIAFFSAAFYSSDDRAFSSVDASDLSAFLALASSDAFSVAVGACFYLRMTASDVPNSAAITKMDVNFIKIIIYL